MVLLASLAGIGYRQGAVRVAFSLVGILLGALLAGPLGKPVKPLLVAVGLKTPPLAWLLAPLVVFVVISVVFKIAALMVHQKVDVYFRYHAGDLRQALWERLSHRLGLCLGLVNGTLYLILLSVVIYPLSYWTVQMAAPDNNPRWVKILNSLGEGLQSSGFAKVAWAFNPVPQVWYESADLAAVVYHNPLIEARLSRYPAFLGLAERPEFQALGSDAQFTELWQRQEPVMTLFHYPQVQSIVQNPELLKLVWTTVTQNMKDLGTYLDTGKSPKYDPEKILGRWDFNVNVAMDLLRQARPNIRSSDMQSWKKWMEVAFAKTVFVATTDHEAILKNLPQLRPPPKGAAAASGPETLKGSWEGRGGQYQLTLSSGGKDEQWTAAVENDRLTVGAEGVSLVFERED